MLRGKRPTPRTVLTPCCRRKVNVVHIILYHIILYYTILDYIILYYTILYYIVWHRQTVKSSIPCFAPRSASSVQSWLESGTEVVHNGLSRHNCRSTWRAAPCKSHTGTALVGVKCSIWGPVLCPQQPRICHMTQRRMRQHLCNQAR